jgi:hypothetical protein
MIAHASLYRVLVVGLFFLAAAATETPAQQQVVMPNAEKIVLLVRNTLITLNNALQTGNFTVLRDTGAPGFREANSAWRLSQAFSNLKTERVDLSAVAVITPQLTEAPVVDQQKGMLRLKGYFPGKPVQIDFEILYQVVNGRWRLFGISVQPSRSTSSPPHASSKGEATTVTKNKGGGGGREGQD